MGQVSALCLLDLTAAFDIVDHELLLLRLERQFGMRGTALMWFRSHLSGRTYQVIYAGGTSSVVYIVCSVSVPVSLARVRVVRGWPCGHYQPTRCHSSLVCRWHAVVPASELYAGPNFATRPGKSVTRPDLTEFAQFLDPTKVYP